MQNAGGSTCRLSSTDSASDYTKKVTVVVLRKGRLLELHILRVEGDNQLAAPIIDLLLSLWTATMRFKGRFIATRLSSQPRCVGSTGR
jgi:hypothetical protein